MTSIFISIIFLFSTKLVAEDIIQKIEKNIESTSMNTLNVKSIKSLVGTANFDCKPKIDRFYTDKYCDCNRPKNLSNLYKCKLELESKRCLRKIGKELQGKFHDKYSY